MFRTGPPRDRLDAPRRCSREEVVRETWRQLKRSINVGEELLRDDDLHSWFLDPDINIDPATPGFLRNAEPLLVNLIDTWALRPEATTAIPNLFLASDYVRTYTDLATMEGANEAARRAVNGLLDAVKFDGSLAVTCGRCMSPRSSSHGGCTTPRDTRPACHGTIHSCRWRLTPFAARRRSSSRRARCSNRSRRS